MATLIKADGTRKVVEPKNGKDFDLDELKSFVGGWFELISVGCKYVVVDEDGRMKASPYNISATEEIREMLSAVDRSDWRRLSLARSNYKLVGDVLICNNTEIQ